MLLGSFTCKLRRQQGYLLEQVTVPWTYRTEYDVEKGGDLMYADATELLGIAGIR